MERAAVHNKPDINLVYHTLRMVEGLMADDGAVGLCKGNYRICRPGTIEALRDHVVERLRVCFGGMKCIIEAWPRPIVFPQTEEFSDGEFFMAWSNHSKTDVARVLRQAGGVLGWQRTVTDEALLRVCAENVPLDLKEATLWLHWYSYGLEVSRNDVLRTLRSRLQTIVNGEAPRSERWLTVPQICEQLGLTHEQRKRLEMRLKRAREQGKLPGEAVRELRRVATNQPKFAYNLAHPAILALVQS
jgi:hypothetical protein